MTLRIPAKVFIHVWSYDCYDMTLSTGKQRRHMINTHWFPLPIDASYNIWLWLAKRFQRRRTLKMVDDGRTPGACLSYKLTYEPSAQVS